MVFSQTSLKTQTVLKVVNLDRLKTEKNHLSNGSTGVVKRIDGYLNTAQCSPVATTSYTEVSLKPEPLYDSAMFHDSAFESFQELDQMYCDPAKAEVVQTIDSLNKTEEKVHNIDTLHIPFSPQGWELGVNSPMLQADFDNITPNDMLSPKDKFGQYDINMFSFLDDDKNKNNQNQETFLDISSLPLVLGDLSSEKVTDLNSWQAAEAVEWPNTDTPYNLIYTNHTQNTTPFINSDDSLDLKFGSVMPGEVEVINLVGSEFITNEEQNFGAMQSSTPLKRSSGGLSVDVSARAPAWPGEISTPAILNDVIALEKEKCTEILEPPEPWPIQNVTETLIPLKNSPKTDYEPITPQSESHLESDNEDSKSSVKKRRRPSSEDSDETYTPYIEQPARKYKRRKPSVPYKDLVLAIQNQPKARRGRPPKRRESTVSSVCSVDENSSSTSTQEFKYRELRDKNNEASKRSRMNRKLKEQEMELLAVELEEKNKRLKVQADILEEMTKKLKNELMSAILKK